MSIALPRYGDTKFEVLDAVIKYRQEHAYGPTVQEITDDLGLSVRSSVQFHVDDLVEQRLVTRVPRKHRSLDVTERGKKLHEVLVEMESVE